MAVGNTLAYYNTAAVMTIKTFIAQAPGECIIKHFTLTIHYVGLALKY
jgi:hypothetical protein